MNKEELIKTLLDNDLNKFRFSVWATYNSEDDLDQFYDKQRGYIY